MSQGKGAVLSSSMKHKLYVKIPTEGGFIGEQDGLSVVSRINNFIEAQGYTV